MNEERLPIVKLYGEHTLAYSTLQDGMEYFEAFDGFIAFKRGGIKLLSTTGVLDSPIVRQDNLENLLQAFVHRYPKAVFYQIDGNTAKVLDRLGYFINEFGTDTIVDLQKFQGSWKSHKSIRRAAKKAEKAGVVVEELPMDRVPKSALEYVASEWTQQKVNQNEGQSFLTRPLVLTVEEDVRSFFAKQGDTVVGYRFFDPLYREGEVVGYYADINRILPDAPQGTSYLLALTAINKFKEEKKEKLALGFSPFAGIEPVEDMRTSKIMHLYFKWMYEKWNDIYNFKGLENHKSRFHGRDEKVYFACKSPRGFLPIFNGYLMTGINPVSQLMQSIGRK